MRIDPKKFSALKAEAGISDAVLSEAMGFAHRANLLYHTRKIKAGEPVSETIIHDMLEAFSYRLRRKVGIRELVYASDLPRETGRVRKAKA